jgi:hypothetical protein
MMVVDILADKTGLKLESMTIVWTWPTLDGAISPLHVASEDRRERPLDRDMYVFLHREVIAFIICRT